MAGGQQINVGQGTVVYGEATDETITGSAATTAAGTNAPGTVIRLRSRKVGGGTSSFLLTGQFATVQQETPVKQVSALLSTPATTGAQGSFTRTHARALSGSQISGAQQTIGPAASLGFTVQSTGVKYSTLQNAINAAASGDTITGVPGTYIPELVDGYDWTTRVSKNLTIKSAVTGSKVVIDATTRSTPGGGAILKVNDGISLTLEDFELTGNKHQDNFNAGLYTGINTGTVTLRRCKIHECSNGVFNSNADFTCVLTLEDCEVVNNGTSAGYYHNFYVGAIASLTLRGCWVHNTKTRADYVAEYGAGNEWRESGGHLVKSRARTTLAEACRITMEVMTGSPTWWGANRCFDISNGGDLTIRGCLLEYRTGQNGGQGQAVAWGAEGSVNLPGQAFEGTRTFNVRIQQNTIVARSDTQSSVTNKDCLWICAGNYGWDGSQGGTQALPAPSTYSVVDNIFCGWVDNPPRVLQGGYLGPNGTGYSVTASTTYAISTGSNTIGATSLLTNASTYDYTPVTPVSGSQNWTAYTYTHPTSTVARTDSYRGGVPSASTPSWVNNINVSEFGDIPLTNTMQDVTPVGLHNEIVMADQSNSGTCWNDDYGPGGAMLLGGGGHTNSEYCYMWLFDGALPGFRALNLQLPARTWAAGSEWSYNSADMPGGTAYEDKFYRPQWSQIQSYPWSSLMGYGEGETNIPTGFHWYNGWFAVPAGKMGMGAKGGFATVMKHSNTKASGIAVRWGHKIDANTGTWTRMAQEMPLGSGSTNMLNNEKGYNRAVRLGDYAYHTFHEPLAARGIVRVNLNTGAYDLTVGCDSSQGFNQNSGSITGWDGIPGTTLLASWAGNSDTPVSSGNPAVAGRFRVVDVDPSISNTVRRYYSVNLTGDALPGGWGDTYVSATQTNGMACVATMWVPEAGKFALFTTTDPSVATQGPYTGQVITTVYGAWPMALFWVTPPANLANWKTDPWVVTRENLTVNASSPKALVEANRRPWGGSYQKCWWSSKLRRFVYIPRFSTGMAFFIRTSLVP